MVFIQIFYLNTEAVHHIKFRNKELSNMMTEEKRQQGMINLNPTDIYIKRTTNKLKNKTMQ